MVSLTTTDLHRPFVRTTVLGAARRQLGVAGAQWAAGIGNLAFALLAARVLAPAAFAELGAFLSGYVLLHLPAAGIGAGAALSPTDLARRRRQLLVAGTGVGAGLAVAAPALAGAFAVPVPVVLALAAAAPGAALLGLERGARFGTGRHARVAAGLVTEPIARLALGVVAASVLGATGAAVAVTAAGYAALAVTRDAPLATTASAPVRVGRNATTVAFGLFAVLQQQDLLVAKLRLAPDAAGTFTMLSTAGGAVAFATATVPLALLPTGGRSRHDDRIALSLTLAVGLGATVLAAAAGGPLLTQLFGDQYGDAAGLFPAYVAAMGLLGLGRVLAARHCAAGRHRRVVVATGVVVVLHLLLLAALGTSAAGIVVATFTATSAGVGVLVTPPGALTDRWQRSVVALRGWATPGDLALLSVLTVAATALRLIATRGLWVDEAITVAQAQLPFDQMLDQLRSTDVHPPLHHAVVWSVVRVLGAAELVVRLPSTVAGALLVPAAHGLGRALYGRRTGLVAASLVTVAPFLVWYSQEARMYSLFMLLATASLWAQVSAIRGGGRWAWTAYAVTTAAMLWTQWFALVPLAAQQLVFLGVLVQRRHDRAARRRLLGSWLLALTAIAVAVAPLVPIGADQLDAYASRRGTGDAVAATTAPAQAGNAASDFSGDVSVYAVGANAIWAVAGYHSDAAMTRLAALWPLLLLVGLGALGRGRSNATNAVLVCIALPSLLFIGAGTFKRDLFELRYFATIVPLVLVLLARAITAVFQRPRSQAVAALACAGLLTGALTDQQLNGANPRKYEFESALDTVTARAGPDDVILFAPDYLAEVVEYYAPEIEARPAAERRRVDEGSRIWLLATTRVADGARTTARVDRVLTDLQEDRHLVREREFPNVRLWELG